MTGFARTAIDQLLTADMRAQAVPALAGLGLGRSYYPASCTGFIAWPTQYGTCTQIYSLDAMLLIAEERGQAPRLVGAAPYDAAVIRARDWSVFAPVPAVA